MKDFVTIAQSANVRSDSHSFALFAHKCWPEIIAVVEAAEEMPDYAERGTPLFVLREKIYALDEKAREVEGG